MPHHAAGAQRPRVFLALDAHRQPLVADEVVVQPHEGQLGALLRGHAHKPKALAVARVFVAHHGALRHLAAGGEQRPQHLIRHMDGQVTHIQVTRVQLAIAPVRP
jgi:hypothetical protein